MDELHRRLGSARESDFAQEAARRWLAKEARPASRLEGAVAPGPAPRAKARPWFVALVARELRGRV